jgi:hypothetical protein
MALTEKRNSPVNVHRAVRKIEAVEEKRRILPCGKQLESNQQPSVS